MNEAETAWNTLSTSIQAASCVKQKGEMTTKQKIAATKAGPPQVQAARVGEYGATTS